MSDGIVSLIGNTPLAEPKGRFAHAEFRLALTSTMPLSSTQKRIGDLMRRRKSC
jgi:hypothetical protein